MTPDQILALAIQAGYRPDALAFPFRWLNFDLIKFAQLILTAQASHE